MNGIISKYEPIIGIDTLGFGHLRGAWEEDEILE
jgi:hypothetical protein